MQRLNVKSPLVAASMCSQNAFTLAEVLITLGIIGIVAAMTLPALTNKYQEKVYETQQKKNKNIVQNGIRLMMARTETFKVENLPMMTSCLNFNDETCMSKEMKKYFQISGDTASGLKPDSFPNEYMTSDGSVKSLFKWTETPYIFATADGMIYGLKMDDGENSFSVISDTNGTIRPNAVKKDLYKYRLGGNGTIADVSSELDEVSSCSIDNVGDCNTEEACRALAPDKYAYNSAGICTSVVWWGDRCEAYPYPDGDHYCSN